MEADDSPLQPLKGNSRKEKKMGFSRVFGEF